MKLTWPTMPTRLPAVFWISNHSRRCPAFWRSLINGQFLDHHGSGSVNLQRTPLRVRSLREVICGYVNWSPFLAQRGQRRQEQARQDCVQRRRVGGRYGDQRPDQGHTLRIGASRRDERLGCQPGCQQGRQARIKDVNSGTQGSDPLVGIPRAVQPQELGQAVLVRVG